MEVQKDFVGLCSLLNASGVDFLIVGGYAVAFHGAPRFTGDLDILIRPEPLQVKLMLEALQEFGFPAQSLAPDDLLSEATILQLGRIPSQIHMMTSITGVTWETAWASRQRGTYGGVEVFFIGRATLLANKRAAGRTKDLADVEALEPPSDVA